MGFSESKCEQAYAKVGILGFQSSGKTTLATNMSIGLHRMCVARGAIAKDAPVFFLDTETGSDWVRPRFDEAGVKMFVDKTRAFTRLVPAIREVEDAGGILIIDSITHYWKELCESYAQKKNRTSLRFEDWAWLKQQWGKFTDAFVNSQCHILMCGRAGFDYDYFEDEAGKKELAKTGIKMKAEGETGYEPSLLILMERQTRMIGGEIKSVYRSGHVLKDRANKIDGLIFDNPGFEEFLPHFEFLNLGGHHVGVDSAQSSEAIVPPDMRQWEKEKIEKDVVLDEIQAHLVKMHPSTKADDKAAKADLLEKHFGTRSWKRVETMKLYELKQGYAKLICGDTLVQAENRF